MKYYKVKENYGGRELMIVPTDVIPYWRYSGYALVSRELVTANEYNWMCKHYRLTNGSKIDIAFVEVNVNRLKVHWCFGARFEIEN